MSTFVGPHTVETQRRVDWVTEYADTRDEPTPPSHLAAYHVAVNYARGDDDEGHRWVLAFDACERDMAWDTYWTLTGSGWVQREDGSGYDRLAVAS